MAGNSGNFKRDAKGRFATTGTSGKTPKAVDKAPKTASKAPKSAGKKPNIVARAHQAAGRFAAKKAAHKRNEAQHRNEQLRNELRAKQAFVDGVRMGIIDPHDKSYKTVWANGNAESKAKYESNKAAIEKRFR